MSLNISTHSLKMIKQDETILAYMRSIKNAKVPSVQEEVELVIKAKNGDANAKNQLLMGHQRFVYSLAKQYTKTGRDIIDYVNEGNLGLLKCIDTYDPTKGFRFITYASHFIRREMYLFMRMNNDLVRCATTQKYSSKVKKVKSEYFNKNGYYPSSETIMDIFKNEYDIDVKDKTDLLDISVGDINYDPDTDHGVKAEAEFNTYTASYNDYERDVEHEHTRNIIISCLSELSSKESDIISMIFGIGKYENPISTDNIADKYNMTVSGVNILKKKVLEKMRKTINLKEVC